MRAIFTALPPDVVAQRKRTGADMRDEMWKGVLHVPPMATIYHQDFGGDLYSYVKIRWARERPRSTMR